MKHAGRTQPVFADPTGWRRHLWVAFNWAAGTLLGSLVVCIFVTSFVGPKIPPLHLRGESHSQALVVAQSEALQADPVKAQPVLLPEKSGPRVTRYGIVSDWDEDAFASVRRNARKLDVLVVGFLRLGPNGLKQRDPSDERELKDWLTANKAEVKVLPLLEPADAEDDAEDTNAALKALATPAARVKAARQLVDYLTRNHSTGVVLDASRITAADAANFNRFGLYLSYALKRHALKTFVAVSPSNDAFDMKALASRYDGVVVHTYRRDFSGSPGPLAAQDAVKSLFSGVLKDIDPKKLIISIGSFGYDWSDADGGREVSVSDAWSLLEKSKARLTFDAPSLNPSFSYQDDHSRNHTVWYLDALTAYNQLQAARSLNPAGIALWQLGEEDQEVWNVLQDRLATVAQIAPALATVKWGNDVQYSGKGEILQFLAMARDGHREIAFDKKNNLFLSETMRKYPTPTLIRRFGQRTDKVVALTFDDGPDPVYTPQILDIMKSKHVPGSFFVVGSMAAKHPQLLKRLYNEGHDIGNHTFTHVNSAEISDDYLALELNATQRLFESELGIRTAIFRAPYSGDNEPETSDEARSLALGASLGYMSVGMNIDPHDWMRPLPDQIVKHVVEDVTHGVGNIVLLHDAGGNRSATVKALPRIIDELTSRGYRFVTVHDLVGLPRAAFMPPIDRADATAAAMNRWSFKLFNVLGQVIGVVFVAGIIFGIFRSILLSVCACLHVQREKRRASLSWQPKSVTVLIPAYNEAKVINGSIRAMLKSRYSQPFDILVVDDGSTDGTADVVRSEFGSNDRVSVVTKPNGGKWTALNFGLQTATSEVIIALDADTMFEPEALVWLLRHFADPRVGAVAGSTMVGNTHTYMGAFQELEYLTSQNLERRALELCNAITVVPGAIGAWRRDAVFSVGGYNGDTLAEDADLTMALPRQGWKVIYESRAVGHTEAPESVRPFLKQRFRWVFGTLQAAYKNASLGASATGLFWVGLPNIFFFHFIFALVAPIIDLAAIWSIVSSFNPAWAHTAEDPGTPTLALVAYYALFQCIDLAGAGLAIYLDRKKGVWKLLPLVLVQRFFYRQLLSLIAVRAFIAICQGRIVAWNSVARTGSLCTEPLSLSNALPAGVAAKVAVPQSRPAQAGVKVLTPVQAPAQLATLPNDRQDNRNWARSVSLGVPAVAIAACAIALLRVPEVVDLIRLTSPPMMQQPRMVVASADTNSAASASPPEKAFETEKAGSPATEASPEAAEQREQVNATPHLATANPQAAPVEVIKPAHAPASVVTTVPAAAASNDLKTKVPEEIATIDRAVAPKIAETNQTVTAPLAAAARIEDLKPVPPKDVATVEVPHVVVAVEPMNEDQSLKATAVADARAAPSPTQANPADDRRETVFNEPSLSGDQHTPNVQIGEVTEVKTAEAIEVKSLVKPRKRHFKLRWEAKASIRQASAKSKAASAKRRQRQDDREFAGGGAATAGEAYFARPRHHLTAMR